MPKPDRNFARYEKPRKRRSSTITIPQHAGPHVRLAFAEMRRLGVTYDEVEAGSGVNRPTIKAWRHKNRPNLDSIEAVLGFIGWDFVPIPRAKVLPAEFVEELRDVAARLDITMPAAVQALVEIVAGIHGRFGDAPSPEAETIARLVRPKRRAPFASPDTETDLPATQH